MGLSGNWLLRAQPKHSLLSWTKSTAGRLQQGAGCSAKHFKELMYFLTTLPEQRILNTSALTWSYSFWSSFPCSNLLSFSLCPIPPQKDMLGTTHIKTNGIKLFKPNPNIFWSDLIINTFITSFQLYPPCRDVLFLSAVPTIHLTALSSAFTWAAGRARSQYWLPPHAHCLGSCLNWLPWSMYI